MASWSLRRRSIAINHTWRHLVKRLPIRAFLNTGSGVFLPSARLFIHRQFSTLQLKADIAEVAAKLLLNTADFHDNCVPKRQKYKTLQKDFAKHEIYAWLYDWPMK